MLMLMTNTTTTMPQTWVHQTAADLFPGYFSVVMATGAMAVCAHLLELEPLAYILFSVGTCLYVLLGYLNAVRLKVFPSAFICDFTSHSRGPGFFTWVAATSILGSCSYLLFENRILTTGFWALACMLWVLVMYNFFFFVTIRERKPTLTEGINGAWLLAAVGTQSVSVITSLLMPLKAFYPIGPLIAVCSFLLGCMLYLAIITLIFYRLTFLKLTVELLTPPYWINMGAVAITTLAGSTLLLKANGHELIVSLVPFLRGFTLLFWTTATWWIPLLVGLTVWRHGIRRYPVQYEPQVWSMIFPLAMYSTGSFQLAQALDILPLLWIPRILFWITLLLWIVAMLGLMLSAPKRAPEVSTHR